MQNIEDEIDTIKQMIIDLKKQILTLDTNTANNFATLENRLKVKLEEIESNIKNRVS